MTTPENPDLDPATPRPAEPRASVADDAAASRVEDAEPVDDVTDADAFAADDAALDDPLLDEPLPNDTVPDDATGSLVPAGAVAAKAAGTVNGKGAAEPATASSLQEASVDPDAPTLPTTVDVLSNPMPTDRLMSWVVTLGITALAFVIRIVHLSRPKNLIFDETYYPKDAWALLHHGYEVDYVEKANDKIAAGDLTGLFKGTPEFMVHPPLGKWLIASGEWLFGMNSFGWRFPSLVFGCLMVAAVIRLGRRLGRSTLIGGIAGLLLTLDGLHFTMSRIGLLDIFQATFLVLAVACVAADRDWFRQRLADHLVAHDLPDLGGEAGPLVLWRPWRLVAGLMFGCALGVKWNSVFVLAVMGVLSVVWDVSARHTAGARGSAWWALLKDGLPAFVHLVLVALPVYVMTWIGWLVTTGGYDRDWGAKHPDSLWVKVLGAPLASLVQYHKDIYAFHTGTFMTQTATHPYDANPAGWLIVQRPILVDASPAIASGVGGCKAPAGSQCLTVAYGIGTPVLWWMAAIALLAGLYFWLAHRDWRFSLVILAACSTWLPWFNYDDRPVFFFYAICIIPFTVIGLALCLGKILGPADGPDRFRRGLIVGLLVLLVAANFTYFYPILADEVIPFSSWQARMWFKSWS